MRCLGAFAKYCALTAAIGILSSCSMDATDQTVADDLQSLQDQMKATLPTGSLMLATCGPSNGQAYYLGPKETGWEDDPISKGRIVLIASPDGKPNILFKDASGTLVDAIKDGAKVSFSFINENKDSFGIIETYPSTGVTQTYAVTMDADGNRTMLWTMVKANISVANITKAAAFVSKCL